MKQTYRIDGLTKKESELLINPIVKYGVSPFNNHTVLPQGYYREIKSLVSKGWLKLAEKNYVNNKKYNKVKLDPDFYSYSYGIAREWNIPQKRVLSAIGMTAPDLQKRVLENKKPLSKTAAKEKLQQREKRQKKELQKIKRQKYNVKSEDLIIVSKKNKKDVNKVLENWIPDANEINKLIQLYSNNKYSYNGRVWKEYNKREVTLRGRPTSTLAYTRKEERKGLTEVFDIKSCIHNIYRSLNNNKDFDPTFDMYSLYMNEIKQFFIDRQKESFIPDTGIFALTRDNIKKFGMRVIFEKSTDLAWIHFNWTELKSKGTAEDKLLFTIYFDTMRKCLGGYNETLSDKIFLIESRLEANVLKEFMLTHKKLLINAYDGFYMRDQETVNANIIKDIIIKNYIKLILIFNILSSGSHSEEEDILPLWLTDNQQKK